MAGGEVAVRPPLTEDQEEFLAFYESEGAGLPLRRLARLFRKSQKELREWWMDPPFRARVIEAERSWPDEERYPQTPYTRRLDLWLSHLEHTGSRRLACQKAKIAWPRVRFAIENNPAFARAVDWTTKMQLVDIEDAYLEKALESAMVAKHVLESNDPKYSKKSRLDISGSVQHEHKEIGDGSKDWLRDRLQIETNDEPECYVDADYEVVS